MQKMFVLSHTHWDREWYEPFQVFRARLVRCIDNLLNLFDTDPGFKHFMLDGQTIVLEDYLEVRPDRAETLRELVASGRMAIGPWYILPDEFLVSGESIIRNLARGMRIACEMGGTMRIGYIPDPFGHISQMPQILRGFGIGTAVFRRGLADEPLELWWQAPDGTRVLTSYLRDSYDNIAFLPHDPQGFVEGIARVRASLSPHSLTGNLLLMNGTDHMEPWADLPALLAFTRERMPDAELVHASLAGYVNAVQADIAGTRRDLPVVSGELRNPKRHHMLPGVASTRMWIKQRNARAQMLLEKWAEPLVAYAALEVGATSPNSPGTPSGRILPPRGSRGISGDNRQLLATAWKYLLQNHPHDSICGCGADATHADMGPRFDWVEQIATPLVQSSLTALTGAIDTRGADAGLALVVFNPTAGPRTDLAETELELSGSLEEFRLSDSAGNSVPYRTLNRRVQEYYHAAVNADGVRTLLGTVQNGRVLGMLIQDAVLRADVAPIGIDLTVATEGEPNTALLDTALPRLYQLLDAQPDATYDIRAHSPTRITIQFVAPQVPAYGYTTLHLTPGQVRPASSAEDDNAIENAFFRIVPNRDDGTLTIADKLTGAVFTGVNRFIDGGDRGDLYNYCPPEDDRPVTSPGIAPRITVERDGVRQTCHLALDYVLPAQLSPDRASRSDEMVHESIVASVSLYPGVPRIDFKVEVDNFARDHRLCVEFPTTVTADHVRAEQAFDVVERAIALPTGTADWIEQPRPEAPMQTFVSVGDDRRGLMLATRGVPEYAARQDAMTAQSHALPEVTLALTLLRCTGWLSRGDLSTRSGDAGPRLETPGAQEIGKHVFEYALIPYGDDWDAACHQAHAFAAPLQAAVTAKHAGTLSPSASFLQVTPGEFVITAIKLPERGAGLIVRGCNVSDRTVQVELTLWRTFSAASRVDLNEEQVAPLELPAGRTVRSSVRPKEIVTFRFE